MWDIEEQMNFFVQIGPNNDAFIGKMRGKKLIITTVVPKISSLFNKLMNIMHTYLNHV